MSARIVRWHLRGVLDLSSIPALWQALAKQIQDNKQLIVSLSEVEHASSGALALLLQGLELAEKVGCKLQYEKIPDDLVALARVSNVEQYLTEFAS